MECLNGKCWSELVTRCGEGWTDGERQCLVSSGHTLNKHEAEVLLMIVYRCCKR